MSISSNENVTLIYFISNDSYFTVVVAHSLWNQSKSISLGLIDLLDSRKNDPASKICSMALRVAKMEKNHSRCHLWLFVLAALSEYIYDVLCRLIQILFGKSGYMLDLCTHLTVRICVINQKFRTGLYAVMIYHFFPSHCGSFNHSSVWS